MLEDSTLYFWFGQPPKVEVGAYNHVSQRVKKTYYICYKDYPEERKRLSWADTSYGKAELIILPSEYEAKIETINEILSKNEEREHIVCGISGPMPDMLCPILKRKREQFIVVSERPRINLKEVKNIPMAIGLYFKYGWLKRLKYQNSVKAVLPLGKIGVNVFAKLHWNKEKLYRFMYCGEYDYYPTQNKHINGSINFLYVGRFGYNHAVDVMMKAFDLLPDQKWHLDMAGGYGEQKDEVIKWIDKNNRVDFIGRIESNKVREVMSSYDCLVVPSRLEGWNCQINEALSIGCPVITHMESVSSELVELSDAGIVIASSKPQEMARAFEYVIQNEMIINTWQDNAKKYRDSFSAESVGNYLLDIIRYTNGEISIRPQCPW